MASKITSHKVFALSQRGVLHIQRDVVLQDASLSVTTDGTAFVAVADGHGGDKYVRSDRGSRLACSVALSLWKEMLSNGQGDTPWSAHTFEQMAASIIYHWHSKVEEDFLADPMDTDEEIYTLYGTTLLCVMDSGIYTYMMQIGDGGIRVLGSDGYVLSPVPDDPDCFLNRTTSLCDANALFSFRFAQMPSDSYRYIFAFTDGVENSYIPENLESFLRATVTMLQDDGESGTEKIAAFLPTMSEQGSGDDVSLACIYH